MTRRFSRPDHEKMAQIAAYFLRRVPAHYLWNEHLLALMYLAERESIARYGHPMTSDTALSTPYLPIMLEASRIISSPDAGGVAGWFQNIFGDLVGLSAKGWVSGVDALSVANAQILESVWTAHGHRDMAELREWMLESCPEWIPDELPFVRIPLSSLALACGYGATEARAIEADAEEQRRVEAVFSGLSAGLLRFHPGGL